VKLALITSSTHRSFVESGCRPQTAKHPMTMQMVLGVDTKLCCCRDTAIKAMRMCPRNMFVPEQHQDEAFTDSPIRLEELDFNVSAPHMHASCLEALQLEPGHKVLDVGAGCGIINACAAYMVSSHDRRLGIAMCQHGDALAELFVLGHSSSPCS